MRFEYILLLILSVLPIVYKLWYWDSIFRKQNYSIKEFFQYIKTREWRDRLLHFWTILEIPIFLISFIIFINEPFEILLFNAFFYLLLLYNIFVIGKIVRKNIDYPRISILIFGVLGCTIFDLIVSMYMSYIFIYTIISGVLLFMPVYFIASLFLLKKLWYYR